MIFFSIILSAFGIAFFCRLLYALAVYALPFFAAISAGLAAFHSGPGGIGAIIVGVAGIATLGAGQLAFGVVWSPLIRAAIALVFAAPAGRRLSRDSRSEPRRGPVPLVGRGVRSHRRSLCRGDGLGMHDAVR